MTIEVTVHPHGENAEAMIVNRVMGEQVATGGPLEPWVATTFYLTEGHTLAIRPTGGHAAPQSNIVKSSALVMPRAA